MLIAGGLIILGGLWIAVTGLLARSQLEDAKQDLAVLRRQISSSDLVGARRTLHDLSDHADTADFLTSGPAWALAAALPGGNPFESIRGITDAVDALSQHALTALLDARDQLDPTRIRRPDGSVELAPISAARPKLDAADHTVTTSLSDVRNLPADTWLSPVDHARTQLLTQLDGIAGTVHDIDVAARVLPPMLGADGTKRYFVGFQNEAEMRGTGGLPGAFGILRIANGKPTFERFENDGALSTTPTGLNLGRDYTQLWGSADATSLYVNSNISPNFPYAARIWTAMWQKRTGERLDGAMAVDPTALSYLLAVTGPATLSDGTQVGSDNVVALTQSTVYGKFPDTGPTGRTARREFLKGVAKAASEQVIHEHGSARSLLNAVQRAAQERRILVWSAVPSVQAELAPTEVSGIVPHTAAPYAGVSVVNEAGTKLDYYLDRSLHWHADGCGRTRQVTATIVLTNTAPAGLPPYVVTRNDHPGASRSGDNGLTVDYLATAGAEMDSVTVNGRPVPVGSGFERGHPVYLIDVDLPRGASSTVVVRTTEPDDGEALGVLHQPGVRPLTVTVDPARCS